MKDFKNYKELMEQLSDEKVCRDFVEQMRWKGNPICPHCGADKPYKLKDGIAYRCRNKDCKKDFSVTKGTIFENSKIPLSKWVATMYILTAHKKGISSHQLGRDIGVTQKTAWFLLHRIRFILGDYTPPEPLDNIVEVDETYVGGKWDNMNKGRRRKLRDSGTDNKVAVMGLLERDGKAKLTVIGKRSFNTLDYFYRNLEIMGEQYETATIYVLGLALKRGLSLTHLLVVYANQLQSYHQRFFQAPINYFRHYYHFALSISINGLENE